MPLGGGEKFLLEYIEERCSKIHVVILPLLVTCSQTKTAHAVHLQQLAHELAISQPCLGGHTNRQHLDLIIVWR
jgi:hypothetical protein